MSTAPNLREALTRAHADHSWWSSADACVVLNHAMTVLTPVARRLHADPADALSWAFEVWLVIPEDILTDDTADLWAYTRQAVRHRLEREIVAAQKVTSASAARRVDAKTFDAVLSLDGVDLAYDQFADVEELPEAPTPAHHAKALDALTLLLAMLGMDEAHQLVLIDALADAVSDAPSVRAAISRAEAAYERVDTTLTQVQWNQLMEMIVGTASGKPGILALAASGHPAPTLEPHISSRLAAVFSGGDL